MGGRKDDKSQAAATTAAAPQVFVPPDPIVTRMPTEADPAVRAAGMRAAEAARKRTGRTSTMLTDTLRSITGSRGQLGA